MLGSRELPRQECDRLLRAGVVGRIAVCTPAGPHVVAADYAVIDGDVTVRTGTFSILGTHAHHALLAFEVGDYDATGRGWSVRVTGRGEVVTDVDVLARIGSTWPPRPWASGMRHLVLRLTAADVTGSRTHDSP